jgi:hypothetical protein
MKFMAKCFQEIDEINAILQAGPMYLPVKAQQPDGVFPSGLSFGPLDTNMKPGVDANGNYTLTDVKCGAYLIPAQVVGNDELMSIFCSLVKPFRVVELDWVDVKGELFCECLICPNVG